MLYLHEILFRVMIFCHYAIDASERSRDRENRPFDRRSRRSR
jgi:hypothetical protein